MMNDSEEKNTREFEMESDSVILDVENDPNTPNIIIPVVKNNPSLKSCKSNEEKEENEDLVLSDRENSMEENTENTSENKLLDDEEADDFNMNKKVSKKFAIVDSDSESEVKSQSKKIAVIESDSENEVEDGTNFGKEETDDKGKQKLKRIALIDSDSENEETKNVQEEIHSNAAPTLHQPELIAELDDFKKSQKRILSNLCDSESSEGEDNMNSDEEVVDEDISDSELGALNSNEIEIGPRKSRKETQKQVKDSQKQEKMTAKKALEQRKEILAESQRRVRESRVSLPYHKPKPRTLREFLQNRPKLASPLSNVPKGTSPSAALKMSLEQLEIVSKKLKEREKEVEEFYKSDSESDNEKETESHKLEIETQEEGIAGTSDDVIKINDSELLPEDQMVNNSEQTDRDNIGNNIISGSVKDNSEIENTERDETEDITSIIPSEGISANALNMNLQNPEESLESSLKDNEMVIPKENDQEKNNDIISNEASNSKDTNDQISEENNSVDMKSFVQINNDPSEEKDKEGIADQKNIPESDDSIAAEVSNSETACKLNIISDVVVKPAHLEKLENKYNLDDDILDESNDGFNIEDYEFNLEGIEEESENIEKKRKDPRKSMREIIEKSIGTSVLENKPRLSGGPNFLIDLENGLMVDDEISKLRERFIKHNAKINKHKHKKEISIVSVDDGTLHKETVAVDVDEDDEEDTAPIEKPGVRFQKLREQLQHRMSERRSELWKKKNDQTNVDDEHSSNSDNEEKKLEEDDLDDLLDNDEEEELTESEEDDEELEENDCDMTDKKRKKSSFLESEAIESDVEENEDDEVEEMKVDEEEDAEDEAEEIESIKESPKKVKVLKRIIKPFDNDDSDDDISQNQSNFVLAYQKKTKGYNSDDDDSILLHQPTNYRTRKPIEVTNESELDFSTPVTYMTGLNNLNTSVKRHTNISPGKFNDASFIQKELSKDGVGQVFDNSPSTQDIMETIDKYEEMHEKDSKSFIEPTTASQNSELLSTQEVLSICSGKFPDSNKNSFSQSESICTQDELAVCSKSISSPEITMGSLKEIFSESNSDFNTQDLGEICSGKFTGASSSTQKLPVEHESALDENEENIISQLIDDEEMERFKKKFESPLPTNTQKTINLDEVEEVKGTGGLIDSDDDDESKLTLKKKRKRLAFSDDEENSEDEKEPEETIDLQDEYDDEEEEEDDGNVEYDSEENEIGPEERTDSKEERRKERIKATEFLEKEAELSESEWGSEDEDEKNLDDMEFEKGDEEKFDEGQLRSDIERLQMKQMLDEDNREVKLLQELLLEDGELHGSGRERQFRWKNIDEAGNELEERKDDDDVYLDDDNEDEEKWRKMRHERELFMMKKQSQEEVDDDCLVVESQKLSFTKRTLKIKSQTTLTLSQKTPEVVSESPKTKQPFTLLNKRGSFLSRSEQMLKKIAESSHQVSLGTKNANRIVFQAKEEMDKKRKSAPSSEAESTPVALKKIRLTELSPALAKKKPKIILGSARIKYPSIEK